MKIVEKCQEKCAKCLKYHLNCQVKRSYNGKDMEIIEEERNFIYLAFLLLKALQVFLKYEEELIATIHNAKSIARPRRGSSYCCVESQTRLATEICNLDNRTIRKHLRISAAQFVQLQSLLQPKVKGWSRQSELMIFLYWLASGASYRVTGRAFNISSYVVKSIVHALLDEFETLVPKVIKHPEPSSFDEIGNGFCRRAKTHIFRRALGAIDGCHVTIKCPLSSPEQYLNSKLRYSIQLQAVCDHTGKFTNVFVGYPGSVHDQRVLSNSPLYRNRKFPPPPYYLLGHSGYKCSSSPIAVITPVKANRVLTESEKKFNMLHSKARNIVECSFGVMKARWRSIFYKDLELKIRNCIKIIAACCVIHNICLIDDVIDDTEIGSDNADHDDNTSDEENGTTLRYSLINLL